MDRDETPPEPRRLVLAEPAARAIFMLAIAMPIGYVGYLHATGGLDGSLIPGGDEHDDALLLVYGLGLLLVVGAVVSLSGRWNFTIAADGIETRRGLIPWGRIMAVEQIERTYRKGRAFGNIKRRELVVHYEASTQVSQFAATSPPALLTPFLKPRDTKKIVFVDMQHQVSIERIERTIRQNAGAKGVTLPETYSRAL